MKAVDVKVCANPKKMSLVKVTKNLIGVKTNEKFEIA